MFRICRSRAYKHNIEVYGKEKANKIARMITKKQRGSYIVSEEDFARTSKWMGFVDEFDGSTETG